MLSFLLLLLSVWAGPAFLAACAPVCTFHLSPLFLKMFPSLFESSRLIFFPQPSTAPSRSMPSVQSCTRCFLFFFLFPSYFIFNSGRTLISKTFLLAPLLFGGWVSECVCISSSSLVIMFLPLSLAFYLSFFLHFPISSISIWFSSSYYFYSFSSSSNSSSLSFSFPSFSSPLFLVSPIFVCYTVRKRLENSWRIMGRRERERERERERSALGGVSSEKEKKHLKTKSST